MEAAPMRPTQATSSTNGTRVVAVEQSSETTAMAAAAAVPWSDLPGDLLAAVSAMVPTVLDRVRLAAVCRPWRAALASRRRLPAPPALPWLLFLPPWDDHVGTERLLYNPEDGGPVMRVPLPSVAAYSRLLGSYHGGWVAAFHDGRRAYLLAIVNLFSGAEVTLSSPGLRISKLVFSEAPTSSGCILAAITEDQTVALHRIGCAKREWKMAPWREFERAVDIAFCNGELYGLTAPDTMFPYLDTEGLVRYKVRVDDGDGPPVVTATRWLYIRRHIGAGPRVDDRWAYVSYIFELHGKPAMAVRARWSRGHDPSFRVFEVVDADRKGFYEWAEVTSLGDHALFVGPSSCKLAQISTGRRGGVEANRVYYFNHSFLFSDDTPLDGDAACMDANGGRTLYSGEDDGANRRIMSVGYYVTDPRAAAWLLPPDP